MDEPYMTKQPIIISVMLAVTVAAAAFYATRPPSGTKNSQQPETIVAQPEKVQTENLDLTLAAQTSRAEPYETPIIRSVEARSSNSPTPTSSAQLNSSLNSPLSTPLNSPSPYDVLPIPDPARETSGISPALAKINQKFQQESYDVRWAAMVESETWQAFYKANIESSEIESVDCRTSICKIIVIHNDEAAEQKFHQTLLAKLNGQRGELHSQITQEGVRSSTVIRYR